MSDDHFEAKGWYLNHSLVAILTTSNNTKLKVTAVVIVKNLLLCNCQLARLFALSYLNLARLIFCCIILITAQGCTLQSEHLDLAASQLGFSREIIQGSDFQHIIYTHNEVDDKSILHVYLDGDGQPWIANRLVSSDPTPENPLILKLMAQDKTPAIYLGRPCYHGLSSTPPCNPSLWTSARYSLQVVKSMQQALQEYMTRNDYHKLVLIGYSGGGTLAMLLAEHLRATTAVVTLAGNLDIDAWTAYHGYSPLQGSLNPAQMSPLDPEIHQYHLIGKADRNVPYHLVEPFLRTQPSARVLSWEKFDHACCWQKIWPQFLTSLRD